MKWLRDSIRVAVLLVLFAGPLAIGAVHEPVFIPMIGVIYLAGFASWGHGHWARSHGRGVPVVPGRGWLLAFHALVLFQLLPLPQPVLTLLSPGSAAFHASQGTTAWSPITYSPQLTLRGLAFLVGMTLLYATAFREFRARRWRHRFVHVVVATGVLITIVALVQSRSADPAKIYGLWKPHWDWAVFGPYVNSTHFAGYLIMPITLSIGLVLSAFDGFRDAWARRRKGWLALFDPDGLAVLRRLALSMLLVVALLLASSRAALAGFAIGCAVIVFAPRRRRAGAALVGVAVLALGLLWADFSGAMHGFRTRGVQDSRVDLWIDQAQLVPRHPVFGVGFNALAPAYAPVQNYRVENAFDQAHNEYLQMLLDAGILGLGLMLPLLLRLFATALRLARGGGLAAGLGAAVFASAANNFFSFNWQIPANAATFFALAGIVVGLAPFLDRGAPPDLE